MNFSKGLQRARRAAGISLDELARRTGISASQLSLLENGKRTKPSVQSAIKIAQDGYGISVNELMLLSVEKIEVPEISSLSDVAALTISVIQNQERLRLLQGYGQPRNLAESTACSTVVAKATGMF